MADLVKTIENSCADTACQLASLVESMARARERFQRVPALYDREIPLIGVVGEIFCRLNTFSNEDLIRKLESYGAEACLSHISEWVEYTNNEAETQAAPDRARNLPGHGQGLRALAYSTRR